METVIASFAHAADLPILPNVAPTPEQEAVLWHIRLPRTLVGMMVGAGLGISGAVLQGIFSNPLADPGIIGVSSGASVGAVLAIGLGVTAANVLSLPAFAFAGSILAVSLTVSLSMRHGRIPVMTLLLSGVVVGMSVIPLVGPSSSPIAFGPPSGSLQEAITPFGVVALGLALIAAAALSSPSALASQKTR